MAVLGRSREQRRYDREQNRLVREANTSLSRDPDKLFNQWQQAGWVTKSASSFDDLVAQYNDLINQGETPAKAREALVDRKAGKNPFGPVDPETGLAKLDRRAVRTRTAPATRQLADQQFGAGGGDKFESSVRDQFDRTGARGGEMRAKARMAHNNVANPDYAGQIQYDLGHYRAAAHPDGAGYDGPMNMDPEPAYINQSHIDKDRIPDYAMREYGIPLNGPEAVAETAIQQRGALSRSGLTTRSGHLHQPVLDDLSTSAYRQAYETAKANGELTGKYGGVMSIKKDPSIYKNWDTGLDLGPENYGNIKSYGQALAISDKAEQLGQQGSNIRPALDELSPTTSKGNAVAQSGPVRRIAPAAVPYRNPTPVKVTTPKPSKPTPAPQSNTNLLRIARNAAPLWASIPLSTMVAGQSAQAAIQNPSLNTGVDAAFDGVSLGLDLASLVPLLAAPAEAVQKGLIIPQAAWEGYKKQQASASKPKPVPTASKPRIKPNLTGKLSAAQIRTFQLGGGQAAMLRDGLTREQVIERGSALLLKQKYG